MLQQPEPEVTGTCCCYTLVPLSSMAPKCRRVGAIASAMHALGFLVGHVPFLSVMWGEITSDTAAGRAWLLLIFLPAIIFWLLGLSAAIITWNAGSTPTEALKAGSWQGNLCCAKVLAIVAAACHGVIVFFEAIIFWATSLSRSTSDDDPVVGLLILKNLICIAAEVWTSMAVGALDNALMQHRIRQHQQQAMAQQMAVQIQMQSMIAQGVQLQPVVAQMQPVVAPQGACQGVLMQPTVAVGVPATPVAPPGAYQPTPASFA